MTEPSNDKILNRVRGLLDKAASTRDEFPAEAKALEDKAMELMAAYGIEQAMLEATGQKAADGIGKLTINLTDPYSFEKSILVHRIAESAMFNCRTVIEKRGKLVLFVEMVGHASDLERVEFLYTLLLIQAQNGMAKIKADSFNGFYTPREVAAHTRRLRASYLVGFSDEIYGRLTELAAHAQRQNDQARMDAGATGPSTALVVASRKELVDQAAAREFGKITTTAKRTYSKEGADAGRMGGRNADLGQDRFGTRGKALTR
jgi:hypothetical protein